MINEDKLADVGITNGSELEMRENGENKEEISKAEPAEEVEEATEEEAFEI